MADKCIGKLTLDITDIEAKAKQVDTLLKSVGAGVKIDLSKQVAGEVKKQFDAIEAEIKKAIANIQAAADQATKAFNNVGNSSGKNSNLGSLNSEITKTTSLMTTLGRAVDATGKTIETVVGETKTGLNAIGQKIKEVTDSNGNITRKVVDMGSQYKEALKTMSDYYSKSAQLFNLEQAGKTNTAQYAKLRNEVEALSKAWTQIPDGIKNVVLQTNEAKNAAQKYNEIISAINSGITDKDKEKALETQVSLYEKYYEYLGKADTYAQKGNIENADMYRALADGIKSYIDSVKQLNSTLDKEAQAKESVVKANLEYEATVRNNAFKEQSDASKDAETNIKNYATALVTLYNEQAKLNNAVASGKIKESSDEYEAATEKIRHMEEAVVDAGGKIDASGVKVANSMQNVVTATDNLVQSQARLSDSAQTNWIERATAAYDNLRNAVNQYNIAKKAHNDDNKNIWQDEINKQMQIITGIEKIIDSLNIEESEREKIRVKIDQAKTLQDGFKKGVVGTTSATGELESQVKGLITRYLSLAAVIRTINSLVQNMVDYVSEYSQKMNEIQMITLKSKEEVNGLADSYRDIAKEMNASSLDIADAAVYFTRQGLQTKDIEDRLKNVTMYAKAANVEFKDASEIITAVINSMGLVEEEAEDGRTAAQRVADVFLKIGDNAATSGQEIGEAMQKAAASAGSFGVSLEWLASYIATVSETTRQEARTIGTAFNTIIARLHQIKKTGYNQEDETQINDIAKALDNIDVELMDNEKNWYKMEDILVQIAGKWDGLDDKTKSYIATTMAGVKQQNVFLALMNDMSKGIEGNSRAFELYDIAMESNGVAAEKYGVYLDSVAAAQDRLTIAQENFYALLDESFIKGWYDLLAKIINKVTDVTDAMSGLNIIIPLAAGAIALLSKGFISLAAQITLAGGASKFFATIWETHPVLFTITAVATAILAITTAVGVFVDSTDHMKEAFDNANQSLSESQTRLKKYISIQNQAADMFASFGDEVNPTSEELERYSGLLDKIAEISPVTESVVNRLREGFIGQKEAAKELGDEIERLTEIERRMSMDDIINKYSNYSPGEEVEMMKNIYDLYEMLPNLSYTFADSTEQFIKTISDAWNQGDLTDEMSSYISNLLDAYQAAGLDIDSAWRKIAEDISFKLFGTFEVPTNLKDSMAKQVINEIDSVIDAVTVGMDKTESRKLRYMLINDIFGNDYELDFSEYSTFSREIVKFIAQLKAGILDEVSADQNISEMLLSSMFPDGIEGFINDIILNSTQQMTKAGYAYTGFKTLGELITAMIAEGLDTTEVEGAAKELVQEYLKVFDDPNFVSNFVNSYISLLDSGFSEEEANEFFKDLLINLVPDDPDIVLSGEDFNLNVWERAAEKLRNKILNAIQESGGISLFDVISTDDEGREEIDMLKWGDLDIETLKFINDLVVAGESLETIKQLMRDTKDVDEFKTKLSELNQELENTGGNDGEAASIKELVKSIKTAKDDIDDLTEYIGALMKGDPIDFDDLMDLAEAHPEILGVMNDLDALEAKLKEIRNNDSQSIINNIKSAIENETVAMANSPFASNMTEEIDTIGKYRDTLKEGSEEYEAVTDYIRRATVNLLIASDSLGRIDTDTIKEWQSLLYGGSNVDLNNRKTIDASMLTAAGWENAGTGIATLFSGTYTAGGEGADIRWKQNVVFDITPITPDGEVLSPDALEDYMAELFEKSANINELMENDKNGLNLLINVRTLLDGESFKEAMESESKQMEILHLLQEALYDVSDAEKTWLQTQAEAAAEELEANQAKTDNYINQLSELHEMLRNDDIEGIIGKFGSGDNAYIEDIQEGIADTYPSLISSLADVETAYQNVTTAQEKYNKVVEEFGEESEQAERAMKDVKSATDKYKSSAEGLSKQLQNAEKYANTNYFKKTATAIKEMSDGTKTAAEAFDTFYDEIDDMADAYDAIQKSQAKLDKGTKLTTDDVEDLADVLGKTSQEVIDDFDGAVDQFEAMRQAGEETYDALNKEATMKILGIGEADFTQLQSGMVAVQDTASETIQKLLALGQFKLEEREVTEGMEVPILNADGTLSTISATTKGTYQYLVPTGSNPLSTSSLSSASNNSSSSSNSSGGGGGSSSSSNTTTEVERMLDMMEQVQDIQDNQKDYYSAQRSYYSQTGQLQGVIAYAKKEKEVLQDQNAVLEDNIAEIEAQMKAKQAELDALDTSDESYEEVADDLDKLQDAHADYTQQIIDNNTELEELNETIEDTLDTIRDMEIDLRDLIYSAIEDREEKKRNMLENEIEMENTIFDIIKKRYETERDEILDATQARIDALQEERDLLSEQLELRKKEAESEDKLAKLRELEAKYQRIIADPTRAKEAQSIRAEIEDLREELSWDAAEAEVEAQQDSIDQQITSLEDYKEYIENYYNDLFEHPQKLYEEVSEIMKKSQEELIEWLKENDEEYQNSSENTRKKMVEDWTDTYNEMHGIVVTYWDEVEEIIAQGDDAIIEFLKENSADYAAAGKLQAEAYVDEWKEKLEDLKKAYEEVETEIAASYTVIAPATSSSSSSSGGSGGSSGSGGGGGGGDEKHGATAIIAYYGPNGLQSFNSTVPVNGETYKTKEAAEEEALKKGKAKVSQMGYSYYAAGSGITSSYAKGGIADFTGPAWLDGTPQDPERVLSPYQTKLFETMVETLERMSTISVQSMPNYGNIGNSANSNVSFGDIIVNVDNLDTEDDYEEMAQKVSEILMERIGQTTVIGGLRINS